jgi:hypothetical protein
MRTSFSNRSILLAGALVAASLSLTAPKAHADAGQGAIRLGADIGVLSLSHFPNDLGPDFVVFQFGVWSRGGLSFGYQVIEPLIIGVRAAFSVVHVDVGIAGSDTAGSIALSPYLEYMFGEGNVRPFIGAQAGFQIIFPDDGDAQGWFIGGPMGGVHLFVTPSFSISPTAMLDFIYRGDVERAGYSLTGLVSFSGWIN